MKRVVFALIPLVRVAPLLSVDFLLRAHLWPCLVCTYLVLVLAPVFDGVQAHALQYLLARPFLPVRAVLAVVRVVVRAAVGAVSLFVSQWHYCALLSIAKSRAKARSLAVAFSNRKRERTSTAPPITHQSGMRAE